MKKFYFTIKLLKRGFVANAKWRKEPGFGMLHHIFALSKHMLCAQTHFVEIESLFELLLNHNLHIFKMAAQFQ